MIVDTMLSNLERKHRSHNAAHTALVNAVMHALHAIGILAWHNQVGKGFTARGTHIRYGLCPGSADIIACVGGVFVGLECKTGSARREPDQIAWARAVNEAGGRAVVVRSVNEATEACLLKRDE